MIQIKNISRTYQTPYERVEALKNINLTLDDSGMVFITGKSGSGKSTFLNLVGGLDKPDQGSMVVSGYELEKFSLSELDAYRNTTLGFVFQEFNLLTDFTVYDNIAIVLKLQGKEVDPIEISDVLKAVDLEGYEKRYIYQLSGGQKQRVAIARAFIKKPKLMIADEPTGSLDSETGDEVFKILKKLSKDCLVIVVSHDKEQAITYGDRIIELKDGKIERDSKPIRDIKVIEKENNLVYSKLNLIEACRFTLKIMFKHYLRLALSVILIASSLVFFSLILWIINFDTNHLFYRSVQDQDIKYTSISESYRLNPGVNETQLPTYLTEDTFEYLSVFIDESKYKLVQKRREPNALKNVVYHPMVKQIDMDFYIDSIEGFVSIQSSDLDKFGYEIIFGELPMEADEILITEYMYQTFTRFGYKEGSQLIPILSYSDIVGKTITYGGKVLKITGILDTKFNWDRYNKILDLNTDPGYYKVVKTELDQIKMHSPHTILYGTKAFEDELITKNTYYLDDYYQTMSLINPGQQKVFINEMKDISQIPDSVMPLQGIDLNTLVGSYVILPISKIYDALMYSIDNAFESSFTNYVNDESKLSLESIYLTLNHFDEFHQFNSVSPSNEWTNEEKIIYRSTYKEVIRSIYLASINNPYASSYGEIRYQLIKEILETYEPKTINLTVEKLGSDSDTRTESTLVVGFYDDLIGPSPIYVSNDFKDDFGLDRLKPYTQILLMNDALTYDEFININQLTNIKTQTKGFLIFNDMSDSMIQIKQSVDSMREITLTIFIIVSVFSILLMFNYMSQSIEFKKKDIGILRSLGTRFKDITKIFTVEALLVSLVSSVVSIVGLLYASININQILKSRTFYQVNVFEVELSLIVWLILFSVLTTVISSLLPMIKLSKMKVVDLLSGKIK